MQIYHNARQIIRNNFTTPKCGSLVATAATPSSSAQDWREKIYSGAEYCCRYNSIVGKKVGIKSVIWKLKTGSGWHQEVWVDPTGSGSNCKRYGVKEFPSWGVDQSTSTIAPNQQVEFRNDCSGAKWLSTEVREIIPPSG